jgi:putative membrane protein
MTKKQNGWKKDGGNCIRGLLMGGADIIPGVSGGTVALILGIYTRLITAISHVDSQLLAHLRDREWRRAARHVDLRFLIALGIGIGAGIVSLGSLMHLLLEDYRPQTLSLFFGLIVASSLIVARLVQRWSWAAILLAILGVFVAYAVTGGRELDNPAGPLALFFCGMLAISAMILPGISGAFIMLLLGVYKQITGILKDLPKGDLSGEGLLALIAFAAGCVVGLLSFSKILRWLLSQYHDATMALLCGFMVGSLRKLWPFDNRFSQKGEPLSERLPEWLTRSLPDCLIPDELFIPDTFTAQVGLCLLLALAAAAFVLALEWLSGGPEEQKPLEE